MLRIHIDEIDACECCSVRTCRCVYKLYTKLKFFYTSVVSAHSLLSFLHLVIDKLHSKMSSLQGFNHKSEFFWFVIVEKVQFKEIKNL